VIESVKLIDRVDLVTSDLAIKRFDLALDLDHQGLPLAINRFARRDLNPAFADAIFFDIGAFFVVDFNANVVLEHGGNVERAARINREPVR
jgi:hypothetical protein